MKNLSAFFKAFLNEAVVQDGGSGSDTMWGGSGADSLNGNAGRDYIYGAGGDDVLNGAAGKDHIYGGAGNDFVDAGAGNDRVWGGAGVDLLVGGLGNDTLHGGAGNDNIEGGSGSNVLYGGAGADSFLFHPSDNPHSEIADFENVDSIFLFGVQRENVVWSSGSDENGGFVDVVVAGAVFAHVYGNTATIEEQTFFV